MIFARPTSPSADGAPVAPQEIDDAAGREEMAGPRLACPGSAPAMITANHHPGPGRADRECAAPFQPLIYSHK